VDIFSCVVTGNNKLCSNVFILNIRAPEIAESAKSGQFVHIRVSNSIDPLLRRPFSIHHVDKRKQEVSVLFRVIGRGTEILANVKEGVLLDVMGPLGRGFDIREDFDHALIAGGGMGVAPLFFLADEIAKAGKKATFLWGAKSKEEIWNAGYLRDRNIEVKFATDDGSIGHKGFVTDLIARFILNTDPNIKVRGFICGPNPMLAKVQSMTDKIGIEWYVSMEERMACGVGVCMGCAVQMKNKSYKMACKDGPVFKLEDIDFDG